VLDADVEVDRRDFPVRAELSVAPGERLALFGPSGAGKTTLLEAVAGLVPLARGRIVLHGRVLTSTTPPVRAVPPWQRRTGLLRQDPGLFPHLSVRGNLGYSPTADRGAGLTELAGQLEIGGLLPAMPARLSGGQRHRVALGRLLLAHSEALLLDEPYSGLDAALRRTLTDLVVRLVRDRQLPTIMVTHELADAQAFASRLAVLDRGIVLQAGTPHEVVLRPASRRVAELVGYLGFVPLGDGAGRIGGAGAGGTGGGAGPGLGHVLGQTVAGVHPDRVTGGAHPDRGLVLSGTMTGCRPSGAGWEADLRVGQAVIVCRLPELPAVAGGQLVVTAVDPPCFGPDGGVLPADAGRGLLPRSERTGA
jgi:ABC-type thiamine transport system ATPase subunit